MSELVSCPQCGFAQRPGPARCEQCQASLRGAHRTEAVSPTTGQPIGPARIVVTGVDVPIGDLAVLLIKLFIASIPVAVLLLFVTLLLQGLISSSK